MRRTLVMAALCVLAFVPAGCTTPVATGGRGGAIPTATSTVATSTVSAVATTPSAVATTPSTTGATPATPSAGSSSSKSKVAGSPSKKLHHPALGSSEREALMDALRPAIQRDLGMKVIFKIYKLNVADDFAFVQAEPLTPSGDAVDYRKTKYKELFQDGTFDTGGNTFALLRYRSGSWRVSTFVIGPTDVAYATWWQEYGAPKSIFPYTE